MSDNVHQPSHYFGASGMEALDVIDEFFADNYYRGQVFKYIARAGKKGEDTELEDLQKARVYLDHEINRWDNPPAYNVVPGTWDEFYARYGPRVQPRVWDSFGDVPLGVEVVDKDGDPWRGDGRPADELDRMFGPYIEVLS